MSSLPVLFTSNIRDREEGIVIYSGLLIFRAVAEPRISTKSVKSREIHQNTRNPREILPNTCRHNIFESYLGCWGCLLAVNVLIYLETSSPQRVNNIPKLPGVLRLCCEKLESNDVKTQAFLAKTVGTGDESATACFLVCLLLWRITPYTFISPTKMTIFFGTVNSVHEW